MPDHVWNDDSWTEVSRQEVRTMLPFDVAVEYTRLSHLRWRVRVSCGELEVASSGDSREDTTAVAQAKMRALLARRMARMLSCGRAELTRPAEPALEMGT